MAVDLWTLTNVQVNLISVYSGVSNGIQMQAARDILAGYTGDYLFFRYDEDSYAIIKAEEVSSNDGLYVLSGVSGTQIDTVSAPDNYYGSTYKARSFTLEQLTVRNNENYLMYGSLEGLPHLIEGASYYGYAQTFILLCFCAAYFIQRIFKHVSPSS